MNKILNCSIILALSLVLANCSRQESSAKARLISSPMPGYSSHREVGLVFEAENSREATVTWYPESNPEQRQSITQSAPTPTPLGGQLYHFHPALLSPGTRYQYEVALDGVPVTTGQTLSFQTLADWQFRNPAPDFSFVTGSCNYMNDEPYDRPGKPYGQGDDILKHMATSGADFMLWLGDNLYFRPAEYSNVSGMWYRYQRDMSLPEVQALRSSMHNYAIWDDHDFGPDDSSKSYELKTDALQMFKAYWENQTYGEPDNPGIYSSFIWSDCAFFMLDGRYYRDDEDLVSKEPANKTMLGRKQLDWLKQSLLTHSRYTFKFIVAGNQFLNESDYECFAEYPADRMEILDFIAQNKINGVIFITGDRHFTELTRMERRNTYPLYDLTSSPISSGVAGVIARGGEKNPNRVEGTLVANQNYCSIHVSGAPKERQVEIKCFDKSNQLQWRYLIHQNELTEALKQ